MRRTLSWFCSGNIAGMMHDVWNPTRPFGLPAGWNTRASGRDSMRAPAGSREATASSARSRAGFRAGVIARPCRANRGISRCASGVASSAAISPDCDILMTSVMAATRAGCGSTERKTQCASSRSGEPVRQRRVIWPRVASSSRE